MHYRIWLILIAGCLFFFSGLGYAAVKIFLRPRDSEIDETYWEFEDRHPGLRRYEQWGRVFFIGIVVSMLMLILAISI
ncbi:MAG: hypothetical protein LLF76_13610 [Planctomycetaceae bacterium]|nr:hypothetical protein [Planctomycetaceae bacterium]